MTTAAVRQEPLPAISPSDPSAPTLEIPTDPHEYTEQILNRGRVFMQPASFTPNWSDKPRRQKFYPDGARIPLPTGAAGSGSLDSALDTSVGDAPRTGLALDLQTLGGLLRDSYGLIDRRLAIQANTDLGGLPWYRDANFSRGTASGGGLYPVSIYLVAGPSSPLTPGVYHYSPGHHALAQLLTGDVSGQVRAAVDAVPESVDTFFVLGLKYWQNAFKYNSFSYHAVTMDLGTIVSTWRLWARGAGMDLVPRLWFDEPAVAELLGVDNVEEAVFAVVPIGSPALDASEGRGTSAQDVALGERTRVHVRIADQERSLKTFRFEANDMMQAACAGDGRCAPDSDSLADVSRRARPRTTHSTIVEAAFDECVALPDPTPMAATVREALYNRRSSFGRFRPEPLDPADLAALLRAAASAQVPCEVIERGVGHISSTYVYVSHVDGIAKGAYRYDDDTNSLRLVASGDQGFFLQQNYFLSNYNLDAAAAVIVPTVRTHAVLDAVGPRGYRLVNATIGAVSQVTYLAAAALGIGCGVALGFDNISHVEQLRLAESGEKPLLIMAVGHEGQQTGTFHSQLV